MSDEASGHLRVQRGGTGSPTLLLLHGLGATSDVWGDWSSLLQERWSGAWVAPDLPGHGGSARLERYSFGALAAGVSQAVDRADEVVVVGHSLGGVVGLALGSGWFGMRVRTVVGLGIKVSWTADELAKAQVLADRPARSYATREEAADRHLRVAGLTGLVDPADSAVTAGLRESADGWELALDAAAFAVGAPDLRGLLAACRADVVLARGETDPMSTDQELAALVAHSRSLPGLGHNAHVEDPAAVFKLLE